MVTKWQEWYSTALTKPNIKGQYTNGATQSTSLCGAPGEKRGLVSALLVRSLQVLKAQGMEEAELGVDKENESGAYEFYKRMGYQTFSTDIWYRKPME